MAVARSIPRASLEHHVGRLVHLRDLLRELVVRDMKLRYKRSVLGIAWSLLTPLAQLLVLSFVFRALLPLDIPDYPAFLLTGLLAWTWFQSSLHAAAGAVVDNRELVQRPGFPVAMLPVVTVASHLVHFALALPVLLVFLIGSGIWPTGALVVLPLLIGLQAAFTLGLAYFAATFQVTFRDTQHLLGILLMLGFYLAPVFYDANLIPPEYQSLYSLNPLVHFLSAYRAVLLRGAYPGSGELLMLACVATGLLVLGYGVFSRASARFAEEL